MRQDLAKLVYDDIGFEDITTRALIPPGLKVKGHIISKEEGISAGVELAVAIFTEFEVETEVLVADGEKLKQGQIIMEISGDPRSILSVERTVLNLMMRMSGIATLTSNIIKVVRSVNPDVIVAGTRKTTPGLQFFEKNAIRYGGGDTHRYRLDDSVLIKDNHLALVGGVVEAISLARKYASFTKKIEIEVETLEEALLAANAGADIVMLDNMDPEDVKTVLEALDDENLHDNVIIEVSGGINSDNILQFAKTGVDVISTGYITHSARSLDLSLELEKIH
ncbi:carboxylating nicotinate-nucleotide diphosphorylase [Methanobacterium formicicum]|uniref:Nicotinate-nucleotide pyrophosphorylase [carboxylating] n=1 Tax=Methanobacterium formicicum (strain DSM 3637 / PP1) TaxID=1204725 RepID=K2RPI1_METFP|nr:carboxylating nicotinate-nucleotide diphosphorylase [Methanobacterium formicicum]EKF84675.1 nicotinate-nucleotide pyrophosphorylase [Methanobacterium formicicum DSM 3637]